MDEQQLQQQIVQLVLAAMQGDQQATLQIQLIMQAAQLGDQLATVLAQMIQLVAQLMLQSAPAEQMQGAQMARFGAKLNYIRSLRGQCPDGYEMQYFKQGGPMGTRLCKLCVAKQKKMEESGKTPSNPIDAFKCGRKMKKKENGGNIDFSKCGSKMKKKACGGTVKEAKCGTKVEMDKCGKKMKKKACGGQVKKDQNGGEMWTMKQSGFLPRTTIYRTITPPKPYEAGVPDTTYQKVVSYGLPFIDDVSTSGSVTHDRTGYYNKVGGGRTEAWTNEVSPSGRAIKGPYNTLKKEYDKMK